MPADPLLSFAVSICGLDEIVLHAGTGVTHALSILDPEWPDPSVFSVFTGCRREVFRFHDLIDDEDGMVAPASADIRGLLAFGGRLREQAVGHLLIHCHAGVSRSTASAAILLAQFQPGRESDAFVELARLRPWSWPNSRMVELADALLGRQGRLVAALRAHHARMIEAWPDKVELIREGPRARDFRFAAG